jgi:hypothetical protein
LLVAVSACSFRITNPGTGDGAVPNPDGTLDGPVDAAPVPRIIPGGGIAGGPVDGMVFVYVIDNVTRVPIPGASVTVGAVAGTTDATGLFTATGVGSGAQTITASAATYAPQLWVGANGLDVTIDLTLTTPAALPSATVNGTVDLSSFTIAPNHYTFAMVQYSTRPTDPQPTMQNYCYVTTPGPCAYSLTTRTGDVGLVATIYDVDTKGTQSNNDDTYAIEGWATHPPIDVTAGSAQAGIALASVGSATTSEQAMLLATPSGLAYSGAEVAVELGSDVGSVAFDQYEANGPVALPTLAALGGDAYDVFSYAYDGETGPLTEAFARAQTGASLTAGAWLPLPVAGTTTPAAASWTNAAGAAYHELAYQPSGSRAPVLEVFSFDGTATVAIPPALSAVVPSGAAAQLSAVAGPIDVTRFSFDDVAAELTGEATVPVTVTAAVAVGSGSGSGNGND